MYRTSMSDSVAPPATSVPRAGVSSQASSDVSSWYGKLASAWGSALDRQADKTVALADQLNVSANGPGQALQVSAAAQQLTFLCAAASNVSNSIGNALETLGRKQ